MQMVIQEKKNNGSNQADVKNNHMVLRPVALSLFSLNEWTDDSCIISGYLIKSQNSVYYYSRFGQ